MATSTVEDFKGGIAKCIDELKNVGFDASAYEIAKWAGVACLIAILVLIIATFLLRSFRNKDLPAAISEPQFALSILIAAALISLPVVAKISNDKMNVDLGSGDIVNARAICIEKDKTDEEAVASDAEFEALQKEVAALKSQLHAFATNDPLSSPIIEGQPPQVAPLLGAAMAIFHRDPSTEIALRIENLLQGQGAGVAVKSTDLTESSLLNTAQAGDIYIIYTPAAAETVKIVQQLLAANDIIIKAARGPFDLKGSSLQILVF